MSAIDRPMSSSGAGDTPGSTRPDKVKVWHLQRLAVVYVRQSSPQQVAEHKESAARQYGLAQRAVDLGWSRDRVLVIDEDQGKSGQTADGRPGFQRRLAEVSLDHAGLILGLEMSRLARSCKDWYQLLERCGLFRTLLGDQDGLYDPTDYNDRLLLGLKGTMSEAELHIRHGRMDQGKLNKARRGELLNHPPLGYVRLPAGALAFDPDEQVQAVVRLIFEQFERQGTVHGLLRYLVHHGIRLGVRPHGGPHRGQLEWRRPNRVTLLNMLHHLIDAGAYRYGHRAIDPRRKVAGRPGTGRRVLGPAPCPVRLRDRFPADITWEQCEANQQRLAANRARTEALGAPRPGPSLLGGLVVCGRCGRRMLISYGGPASRRRYRCTRATADYAEPTCQSLAGRFLDELVAGQVLQALQPAALELSLRAADDLGQERARLEQHWQQQRERARYEADRAARQSQAVEPENRLVARELERRWEEALARQRQLEEEYDRSRAAQPAGLTPAERSQIRARAEDLPGLWAAPTTTAADRQRIARLRRRRVTVAVVGDSERVTVERQWAGGDTRRHELTRPVARYSQRADYPRRLARVGELRDSGMSLRGTADVLNRAGFVPPKRTDVFPAAMVRRLRRRPGVSGRRGAGRAAREDCLGPDEWWPDALADALPMPLDTLRRRMKVGWVHARQLPDRRRRWVVWADADERDRLARRRGCDRSWASQPLRDRLIIPKARSQDEA
jgi:DNA invertase Pin-like site-specific DNA recombinase